MLKLRGRTTLEKSLIVFSVLATITTLVFLITFAVTYTSAMEDKGTEPLRELLVKNGAWPVIDTVWIESNFKIVPTLVKLQAINLDPIINMFVSTDFKDSSKRVIYIDQPSFGMPGRDYFLRGRDDVMLKAYEEYGINLAVEMGTDRLAAEADFKDLVDFEIQLANVSVPAENRRDGEALYNPYTIANLSVAYPNVGILHLKNM
ncbi:hypothetical protein LOTGIDRAFT_176742 [Lottia gigantea]|uniref:Peptidase M13 N-terminal domain-containing protein n=1 Tax=Lottia gigantea TaxID=225164 RepID=V3ZPW8_LOTGI|nr:hypothetical protein LOTGIDRAFT_176742 [Lottia gigantea]ESO93428.1 hypothetical protein LOTGIDRAFT_176742 [Lottia gigantea]